MLHLYVFGLLTVKYIHIKNINSASERTPCHISCYKKRFIGSACRIDVEGGPFRSEASNTESGIDEDNIHHVKHRVN